MYVSQLISIGALIALVATTPVPTTKINPRTDDVLNHNILVKGPNNTLTLATRDEAVNILKRTATPTTTQLTRRDCPADGSDAVYQWGGNGFYCASYCEASSPEVTGIAVTVSDTVDCTGLTTCTVAHAYAVTITSSITFSVGLSSKDGDDTFNLGATWTYSQSLATSNMYTFGPPGGSEGYIVFKPYYKSSQGVMTVYEVDEDWDSNIIECLADVISLDPNASGLTPLQIANGEADGVYSFCEPSTGNGC